MVMEQMELAQEEQKDALTVRSIEEDVQSITGEDVDKAFKKGEKVLQAGKEVVTLGKDAKELYDSVKAGDWRAAGEAAIKTIQDLLNSNAIKELGKEAVERLKNILRSRQRQELGLPDLDLA